MESFISIHVRTYVCMYACVTCVCLCVLNQIGTYVHMCMANPVRESMEFRLHVQCVGK